MAQRLPVSLLSVLCLGIAFLYLPIAVLVGYSFNVSALSSVWGGFSTQWYVLLLDNAPLRHAAWLSLQIAVASSTGALLLGTLASIALVRFTRFRGRFLLTGMINAPLVMPEIITGITQLLLFVTMLQWLGWPARGVTTVVLSHIAFCSAYVAVTVQSRLQSADLSLEEAAMDLGATRLRAFMDTTLPIIAPALLSSWLLCFTLSIDDLVISSFVSGPRSSTLPMLIYSKVKMGVSPDINALATVIITVVGSCVIVANLVMQRAERRRAREATLARDG